MEQYTGVKFACLSEGATFEFDERLARLNSWAFVLAGLGLTPVHAAGAYGNQSYRTGPASLVITKSGMIPEEALRAENFVLIEGFDEQLLTFRTRGPAEPSSESILHYAVYREFAHAGAIMHGHSGLLERHAEALSIPVTACFLPYGTEELADSAIDLLQAAGTDFIILKNHGFVAVGGDIDTAGRLVLEYCQRLIALLKQ
ncbi:MAG: class II aldolase/adducin family protein [Desulfocapsaceae bacterium]|nr:class II aldolase/adducin family protein [Desulfocapsaceae bacterium]